MHRHSSADSGWVAEARVLVQRVLRGALLLGALGCWSGVATAQPAPVAAPAEPAGYREAIDAAIVEHEARHFAESRALFGRAHALFPNARSLRGLGMADFELRNYAVSIEELQAALASTVKPLDAELRRDTEQLLARAKGFVGRFRLNLRPPTATVTLSGAALAPEATSQVVLSVGDYTLEVSAPGYVSERRELRVIGGEDAQLDFTLPQQAAVAPVATAPAAPPATESSSSVLSSPWLWAAVGAVVVGTAIGIGVAASSGGTTREAALEMGSAGRVLGAPK